MISCYKAFTRRKNRWLLILIYPLVLILLSGLIQSGILIKNVQFTSRVNLLTMVICALELWLDNDSFGGILSKKSNYPDYFILSKYGVKPLLKAVHVDAIRRFAVITAIFLADYGFSVIVATSKNETSLVFCLGKILILYLGISCFVVWIRSCLIRTWINIVCYLGVSMNIFFISFISAWKELINVSEKGMLIIACVIIIMSILLQSYMHRVIAGRFKEQVCR